MTNQISSTLIGQQGKKPQNNSKHGEGHADHEEAQAGDQAAAGSVLFGCLFTRKQGLGYSRVANYSQAGGWTTGYPLITPGSS